MILFARRVTRNERIDTYISAPGATFKCITDNWALKSHRFGLTKIGLEEGATVSTVVDGMVYPDGSVGVMYSETFAFNSNCNTSPQNRINLKTICLGVALNGWNRLVIVVTQ